MRCQICGQVSLPGVKLCLDCKAARKRAFDATVTQPLLAAASEARGSRTAPRLLRPSQSVPDAARRAAKMALAAQAQARIAIESPPRRIAPWPIIGVMGLAVVAVGYFGHWFGGDRSATYVTVPVGSASVQDSAAASNVRATTLAPSAVPPSAAATAPVAIHAAAVEPPTPAAKAEAAKRASVRLRPEKAPVTLPPLEPTPPPVIVVARPPPPPVVREAPRPDRWQLMAEAIARCPRGDFSGGGYSCEQRLRAQYCEGHWGQVPQCASIPYTDHGQ
jgi:hypothetical protein